MAFTNSPLVTYTNITKNKTKDRNHAIDTITIHCYVGQVTAKQGCDAFAKTDREVSSNYVVGYDGSIGLSVEEKNRASTSTAKKEIKVGSTVKVKKGAKTFNGGNLASFVYERNHKVKEVNVDRVVITYNGIVIAAVKKSDLTLVE